MVSCTFPHPYASNKALEGKKKQYKILTPKFPTPPYKAIVSGTAEVQNTSSSPEFGWNLENLFQFENNPLYSNINFF